MDQNNYLYKWDCHFNLHYYFIHCINKAVKKHHFKTLTKHKTILSVLPLLMLCISRLILKIHVRFALFTVFFKNVSLADWLDDSSELGDDFWFNQFLHSCLRVPGLSDRSADSLLVLLHRHVRKREIIDLQGTMCSNWYWHYYTRLKYIVYSNLWLCIL